jgi:ribosomal protein L31
VFNPTNAANNNAIVSIRTNGSSAGSPYISLDVNNVGGWVIQNDNSDSSSFKIKEGWDSTGTTSLQINRGTRNVGIGTAPAYRLDVAGVMRASTGIRLDQDNAYIAVDGGGLARYGLVKKSGVEGMLGFSDTTDFSISTMVGNTQLSDVATASVNRLMTFKGSSCNIGIGTFSPSERLHVAGNILCSGVIGTTSRADNCMISLWNNNAAFSSTATAYLGFGVNTGILRYQVDVSSANHVFYANTTELMRIAGGGNVGIGTSSPSERLHVTGNILSSGVIGTTSRTDNCMISLWNNNAAFSPTVTAYYGFGVNNNTLRYQVFNTTANHLFYADTAELMRITGSGNVGINQPSPQYRLDVSGDIYASGDIIGLSDARYKTNLKKIDNVLERIDNIYAYTYNRKDFEVLGESPDRVHVGCIAQEVVEEFPEVTSTNEKGDMSISYTSMVPLLLQAIKELKQEVIDIKRQLRINP